jgi:hypothetical protein
MYYSNWATPRYDRCKVKGASQGPLLVILGELKADASHRPPPSLLSHSFSALEPESRVNTWFLAHKNRYLQLAKGKSFRMSCFMCLYNNIALSFVERHLSFAFMYCKKVQRLCAHFELTAQGADGQFKGSFLLHEQPHSRCPAIRL